MTSSESAAGYKSPPTLSAVSTIATTAGAKSTTGGKFTTANFIETTIQPSPANFGSVGGAVTTLAVSGLSTASTTGTVSSPVASVVVSSESLARSPTSSYGLKMATSLSPTGSGGFTAKSSAVAMSTVTSSAATFSNTFQNFVGQNYVSQLDGGGASDIPMLSSPEIPRGKKRQTKFAFSLLYWIHISLITRDIAWQIH